MKKKDILADVDTLRQFIEKDSTGIGIVPKFITQGLQIHEFYDRCGEYIHVDARTIETGDYPFSFSIFALTSPSPLPEMARSFFEFLSSRMGQMVAERTGYARTSSRLQQFVEQGGRLSHALINASTDVTISDLKDMVRNLKLKKDCPQLCVFLTEIWNWIRIQKQCCCVWPLTYGLAMIGTQSYLWWDSATVTAANKPISAYR